MQVSKLARFASALTMVAAMGCATNLDVANPNAPDTKRALSDPNALEAVGGGSLRTWVNTWSACEGNCPMDVQSQSYSASWNNFNMNFYAQIDQDGTRNTRGWQNDPAATGRTSVEGPWTGYYGAMSSASDVLRGLRVNNIVLDTPEDTKRLETVTEFVQAASEMSIALMYDRGYIVDETVDVSTLTFASLADRKTLRDAARARFDEVIALAAANTFTTPTSWLNGFSLTNTQIGQLANTMAALLLAEWPRDAAENAAVDWAAVASYASKGMSSGTAFDFQFTGDGTTTWNPETYTWFNSMDTGRLHTRVAHLLDPATQADPWPAGGNPQPNSPDKRLGDGSFGTAGMFTGFGNVPKTANAGTDFAWSSQAIFNAARGDYQQSNIAHIRYDKTGTQDPSGIYGGSGTVPIMSAAVNDLLWAEGLIRSGGSLATAATLINNTRVTRGGLPPAVAGDGVPGLLTKLQYEQDVELLGMGPIPQMNRRRLDALITGTPHEMPIPAKELGVFTQPLYSWGGKDPVNSPTPP